MGKSSSGKDTIYKKIREKLPQLKRITPYTTRPIREGETDGVEYFFVDEERLNELKKKERVIEVRSYNTKCGIWTYFTADDGQIDLQKYDYLVIGTLESYYGMREYFGEEQLIPIYIEVEDGPDPPQTGTPSLSGPSPASSPHIPHFLHVFYSVRNHRGSLTLLAFCS